MKKKPLSADVEAYYSEMRQNSARRFKQMDPTSSETIFNLVHTFNLVHGKITDDTQDIGVTLPGFNVLNLLNFRGEAGLPLSELSSLLLVSRANITGLVDSLERKGLVERMDHARDRRVYLARLTKSGKTLLDKHLPRYFQAVSRVVSGLNSQEKKTLIRLLSKLRQGMELSR